MHRLRKGLQNPLIVSLCVAILAAVAVFALRASGALQTLELKAYDWQLEWRGPTEKDPPPILIVQATEDDIRTHGWPLTDAQLATILNKLVQYKARAIGLDIYRDLEVAPGHEQLNEVLAKNRHIIAAAKYPERKRREVPPPPILKGTQQVGANDVVVDSDGIVRRGLIYLDDGVSPQSIAYSLATRLALLYLGKEALTFDANGVLVWGESAIKAFESSDGGYMRTDAAGYQFLLDFRNAVANLPSVTVSELLGDRVSTDVVANRIVLIGVTAESVPDSFYVPVPTHADRGQLINGVELHANSAAQLLRLARGTSRPIATTSESVEWLLIALGSFVGSAIGLWIRSSWRYCLALGAGILFVVSASQYALAQSHWVPIVPVFLPMLLSALIIAAHMSNQEKLQRGLLMQIFSRHVSPEVAETVWNHREEFLDGGRPRPQELTVTVMFTDLVNFTAVSESKRPEALLAWLNEYMEQMSKQVIDRGGVINKYIGDSVMGIFGVPVPRKTESEIRQDAVNAVNCALQMGSALARLNEQWTAQKLPVIGMRVGIYTGLVVVGSLGGSERLEYTIIGDTVNTASRLEGFDKESFVPDYLKHPCRVLVGESTRNYLGDEFELVKVGEASLKGKETKITVYNVLGRQEHSAPAVKGLPGMI